MAALPLAIDAGRSAPAADRVPTLTEVVELGQEPGADDADVGSSHAPQPQAAPAVEPLPDIEELSAAVLADLRPRIESLFEARLREALAPALARAADGLIRDTREQLAATLQALVREAAAKVLEQRQRR